MPRRRSSHAAPRPATPPPTMTTRCLRQVVTVGIAPSRTAAWPRAIPVSISDPGGSARDGAGYFFEPTVLSDIPPEAELLKEEIFGPVAPVASFESEEDAVAAANDTEYGLVAYVYTSDLKRALRVCEGLETGMVGLNQGMVSNPAAPFGGVKQSGFGREGGLEGIEEYLETKYCALTL